MGKRFRGVFHHTVDKKGRMSVPAKFRPDLGEEFVFAKGPDNCLYAYPTETWEEIEDRITNNENFTKAKARKFVRMFHSSAGDAEMDAMGRVLIPPHLREYAGFEDRTDVVVIGVADRVEIWSENRWNEYCQEDDDTIGLSEGMELFDI